MATGGRQPRASGSPSEQARNSTLLARPEASVTICDGMQEQLKLMPSSRPSVSSSSEAGTLWSSSMQLMVTFSAPSRSAVRPASKATSPPPMTTTFLPMSTFSPSEAALSTLDGVEDALGVGAGDGQGAAALEADGEVHGLVAAAVLLHEAVDGEVRAGRLVDLQVDAERGDAVDVLLQGGLGQAVLGDAEAQHAARLRLALEHGDGVAEQREVAGGGEAAGARADDGDLLLERDLRLLGQRHVLERRSR